MSPLAMAQDSGTAPLEEIIVTAQKRDQSLQDVPISISVLNSAQLTDLGIRGLEDFVQMLPNVSYVQLGPGSGEVYIRGVSSGGNSILGSTPNVATYLDEQPITAVNAFLNPHIYDIDRIEVLAGPQGTLFGANAQSGAIRIITNKPDPSQFSAGYDAEVNSVEHGELGYLLEGYVNIPMGDRTALRLVGWYKEDPGFVDNMFTTHTFSNANIRAGLDPGDPLNAVAADITINNAQYAKKDFNTATTAGARAALKVDLTDNWSVTASIMGQNLESEGVWDHDPDEVGDLQVTRFQPDSLDDEWLQGALVLEGQLGSTTLTYAGSYLDRDVISNADYSLYTDYYISGGFVQAFYSCYVTYFLDCTDPRELLTGDEDWNRTNHELRWQSAGDQRFRWLVGAFYEEAEHHFDLDWHVLGLESISPYWNPDGSASQDGNAAIDNPDIYWTTDQVRSNEETAFFGQLQYDFTDQWTGSVSARHFIYDSQLIGFSGTIWWPTCCWQRPPFNTDLITSDEDTVYRANLTFSPTDDAMFFFTYSEGYRPGGLNRVFDTPIGGSYDPDFLTSFEIGAKSTLMDGRMRLNGSIYFQQWDDFQLSRLDSTVSLLTLTDNVGTAESNGIEADMSLAATDNWQVSAAFSYNKAEITEDYWINKANEGDGNPDAKKGLALPRVPEFKFNITSRNDWTTSGGTPQYLQFALVHTGESWNVLFSAANDIRTRKLQHTYNIVNAAWGIEYETWSGEIFVRNLFDERAEVFKNGATWDSRITTNRPRTIGIRFRQGFE